MIFSQNNTFYLPISNTHPRIRPLACLLLFESVGALDGLDDGALEGADYFEWDKGE